ncbi:MAG: hypothetical protein IJW70_11095 [Clostridia bacterium]|nr:hypothetical protein [Clostridia bacterium]
MVELIVTLALLVVFVLILVPLLILAAVVGEYVLQSLALWRLAKQTGACKPAYAWIPVVQYWVMGKCTEACDAENGKKPWPWGKILLICAIVHASALVFALPLGILFLFFGMSFLLELISWASAALTVASLVCVYKIYHRYMQDPWDILAVILHTLYPGYLSAGLLIVSFLKPVSDQSGAAQQPTDEAAAVIPAEVISDEELT